MAGANASKFKRLDMPSESTSGDPEILKDTPVETEDQQTKKTGKKKPPQKK